MVLLTRTGNPDACTYGLRGRTGPETIQVIHCMLLCILLSRCCGCGVVNLWFRVGRAFLVSLVWVQCRLFSCKCAVGSSTCLE
jgi:hypothetical protein